MITKNQKVKGSVIKVLLTLPVFALLILLNTQCDNTKPNDEKQSAPVVENNSVDTQSNLTPYLQLRYPRMPLKAPYVPHEEQHEQNRLHAYAACLRR